MSGSRRSQSSRVQHSEAYDSDSVGSLSVAHRPSAECPDDPWAQTEYVDKISKESRIQNLAARARMGLPLFG